MEELKKLIAIVRGALEREKAETPEFDHNNYDAWRSQHEAAVARMKASLEVEGARFGMKPPHDHWVNLAGIRSSSTSGFVGAVQNWVRTADARIEGGAR